MSYMNQWGTYENHDPRLAHIDDAKAFDSIQGRSHLFQCIGEDRQFLTIQYGESRFRVKPDGFRPQQPSKFQIGDKVVAQKDADIIKGTICDVFWHFNREKHYYQLIINGKRSGKWYFDEDLEPSG